MKKKRGFLALAVIAGVLLTGCDVASLLGTSDSKLKANVAHPIQGMVLGLDGKPAANVAVHGLISNNAAGLISNNAAGLIGNNSAALVGNNSAMYHTQATDQLETRTDSHGNFVLGITSNEPLNVEAVLSDDAKALMVNVKGDGAAVQLKLAPTGKISGKVKSAFASLTNLLGTDIFVPGTSYQAKADKDGNFTIDYVPTGTFELVGILGRDVYGALSGITVAANQTTSAPDLVMGVDNPKVAQVAPLAAAPGATVTLTGANFGISKGFRPEVKLNGVNAEVLTSSDTAITAKLPAGALSGQLYAVVNNLPSNATAFKVIKSLAVYPSYLNPAKDSAPTGDTLASGRTRTYQVKAIDTADTLITVAPGLSWSSSDAAKATVAADGTVTAVAPGTVTLSAVSGGLKSDLAIQVVGALTKITVTPDPIPTLSSYPVGAADADTSKSSVQLAGRAWYQGSSEDAATPCLWSSDDSRLIVSPDGTIQTQPGAASGNAILTVTSVADPSKIATVSIPIARQGTLTVGIQ